MVKTPFCSISALNSDTENTFNASANKQKVASVEAQYHCMSIIHKTIKFLNENQIPIDVSDHPVYS